MKLEMKFVKIHLQINKIITVICTFTIKDPKKLSLIIFYSDATNSGLAEKPNTEYSAKSWPNIDLNSNLN